MLDIYHSNDWILDPLITIPGEFKMRKLKKESSLRKLLHSDDLETQLAANTAAQNYLQRIFPGNRPSLDDLYCDLEAAFEIDNPMIFRSYAKRAGSMNHVAMFIETMNEFGVNPDIDVFVGLTNGVETLADAQQFLTLMHDCGIDPTSDVFAGLSRGAKTSMEAHKILELMTKSGIQPDQRHYRAFLSACATVEEAGDFLRLLSDLGQRPLRRDLLTLLHNAPDQHEAERIRDLMRSFGFCSNHVAWLVLIDTLPTWALIWDAYTSRSPRSKCMRKHVVGRLLENCQDGTELITTLEEIHRYKLADLRLGYKLTDIRHAIDRVLRSALSDSEIIRILRRLGSLGLEIDSIKPYYYVGFPGSERFALLREQARSSD